MQCPKANEVIVYCIDLDSPRSNFGSLIDLVSQTLSRDELGRAERFLVDDVRKRFILCRLVLRLLLASLLKQEPAELAFAYGQWGKPKLAQLFVPALHFNVSHCEGWAVIAVSQHEVGIDLEIPRPRLKARAILSQILAPEEHAAWNQIPAAQQESAALRLWTCKEALLKGLGLGIAEGLKKIVFPIERLEESRMQPSSISASLQLYLDEAGDCRMTDWIDASSWCMFNINPIESATCTLAALSRSEKSIQICDLDVPMLLP